MRSAVSLTGHGEICEAARIPIRLVPTLRRECKSRRLIDDHQVWHVLNLRIGSPRKTLGLDCWLQTHSYATNLVRPVHSRRTTCASFSHCMPPHEHLDAMSQPTIPNAVQDAIKIAASSFRTDTRLFFTSNKPPFSPAARSTLVNICERFVTSIPDFSQYNPGAVDTIVAYLRTMGYGEFAAEVRDVLREAWVLVGAEEGLMGISPGWRVS